MAFILDDAARAAFHRDGYFIARGLFDAEETALLRAAMETDPEVRRNLYDRFDSGGKATKMVSWNHPGDSVYGLAARSRRIVDAMADLLGDEVYHYHSKLTAKEPRVGGAWEWHQDYGYWYNNGCLFPDMASVQIALDRTDRDNGCLQVLRGSNRMGRIDHKMLEGSQVGADPVRVGKALERLERVYCEMEPGDGVFFHCNTLHRSDRNESDNRRWTLICCYNARGNDPYLAHHHPFYSPIAVVEDDAIKAAGMKLADGATENFSSKPNDPPEIAGSKAGREDQRWIAARR
jgi:ectoine hydroxylase-related dioxygenase (phytanoyl-CoA dioxygenase family)